MSLNNAAPFRANGTIAPRSFVKIDTTGDNLVVQAGAGDAPIGVVQIGMKRAPGLAGSDITVAAATGDVIQLYSIGDVVLLDYGGTVTRGDYLKSDANGKGVTASTSDKIGAICLQSGVSGGSGLVQLVPMGSKAP